MSFSLHLRTGFAIISAVLIILLSALLSMTMSKQTSLNIQEEIGDSLSNTSYQLADKLDHYMWSRAGEVDVLSTLDALQRPDQPAAIRKLLDQLQTSIPSFTWVGYMDAQGNVVASTNGILTGQNIAQRPVFQNGIKGTFIGDVHEAVLLAKLLPPNPSGEPLQFVDISRPVHNTQGEVVGVLAAHLSWEWSHEVEDTILQPLKDRANSYEIFIVSKQDNTVLLGPDPLVGSKLELASIDKAQHNENGWSTETWPDGKQYLTGYAYGDGYLKYPGLGWTVLVREPVEIAFASVHTLRNQFILLGVGSAIVFAILGWYAAGFVSKPLKRIAVAAERLRKGEDVQIPHHRGIRDIEMLSTSLISLVNDLTRTERALDRMENLAHHDKLTGLPNRIALDSYIEESKEWASKEGHTLTFLYLDLDGFKGINDTLGHLVGDALLQNVAARLQSCMRSNEIAARLGGDEFLAILKTTTPERAIAEGSIAAERIIQTLNQAFVVEGRIVKIGCSVGGAVWPAHSADPIDVMRLADEALYASKRSGKNRITFAGSTHTNHSVG
ncbi:diguanylate cyclase (GGDEF)-like protein [Paenibacillus phyllosphaerae]|uniref:Diguanylate cyclase (GGDEF)-like protein n=1 Tax=Paenibacillus phyllosphaerae TaxID=274593 RepID=A0A7W5AVH0_9BACL|nr:sensor domain-containing diguanylate cyclase [Paenibacillus phyllosphaerae]MBB3109520.1 diguanylate cyclase (GGDEF)-like protein [Paenibacillus phyllosphaerae]